MAAGRAHVGQADAHVAGQLALDVDRILVHARRVLFGSMNVIALLTPVSSPSELPEIGVKPVGNGLSIDVIGVGVSCCRVVVCE